MTKIRSLGVFSVAKVYGLVCGVFGLILAPFVLLGPGLAMAGGQRKGFGATIIFVAILPLIYAFLGFLVGGLMAFLYNAIAGAVGGIELEVELPQPTVNLPQIPAPTLLPPPILEVPPPAGPEIG